MQEITATELKQRLDAGEDVQIIDVRQPDEFAHAHIEGTKLIPLSEIMHRINEIDPAREAVMMCRSGVRSARAIDGLRSMGYQGEMTNLAGGILAWSRDVDPSVPQY